LISKFLLLSTNHNFTSKALMVVVWFMVFNATFNTILAISWRSVLLMEETEENHRPVTSQ